MLLRASITLDPCSEIASPIMSYTTESLLSFSVMGVPLSLEHSLFLLLKKKVSFELPLKPRQLVRFLILVAHLLKYVPSLRILISSSTIFYGNF